MRAGLGRSMPSLVIDGAHGEGGGQILRTALSIATLTGRSFELVNIRANRPKPGLAAQHLTAVRAAAAICGAAVEGDQLRSVRLIFAPSRPARAGDYLFDVAEAREGGSAGSISLVLQTVLLPLALASGRSTLTVRGGTHVPWSPSVDYVQEVWLPALSEMGLQFAIELLRWGWYPAGGGEVRVRIEGLKGVPLTPFLRRERGALCRVRGRAVTANLPGHIARRMSEWAQSLLNAQGIAAEVRAEQVSADCAGAGIFLVADYKYGPAGSGALGKRGKPSEAVADEAVGALLAHHRSGAAVDAHLADQLLLPAAFADGESHYSTERVTRHLTTSGWVIDRFGVAQVLIVGSEGEPGMATIEPAI